MPRKGNDKCLSSHDTLFARLAPAIRASQIRLCWGDSSYDSGIENNFSIDCNSGIIGGNAIKEVSKCRETLDKSRKVCFL